MRRMILAAIVVTAPMAVAAEGVAVELTEELIAEAIEKGEKGCYPLQKGNFMVGKTAYGCFSTPYSRVVAEAAAAKKRYRSLDPTEVTPELVAPGELHVHGFATAVEGGQVASVEAIVILPHDSEDPEEAIHPIRTEEVNAEFQNAYGAKAEGRSIMAVFPLELLSEDYDVHIVFDRKLGNPGWCDDCDFRLKVDDDIK